MIKLNDKWTYQTGHQSGACDDNEKSNGRDAMKPETGLYCGKKSACVEA